VNASYGAATSARLLIEEEHHGRRVKAYADRPKTICAVLDFAAARDAEGEALKSPYETLSFRDVRDTALRLAAGLRVRGVGPGDRIAVLLPNDTRICLLELAAAYCGAIIACFNTRFPAAELKILIDRSEPKLIVIDEEFRERIPRDSLATDCELVVSAEPHSADPAFSALFDADPLSEIAADEDDPWLMLFTSGTTGVPKGALLTHGNVIHSSMTYVDCFALGPEASALIVMPLYYATAIIAQMIPLFLVGGRCVIATAFKASEVIETLALEKIEYLIGVPTMYQLMLLQPGFSQDSVPLWRVGAYGGAPMPSSVLAEIAGRFPKLELYDAYGLTETSSPITIMTPEGHKSHSGSVGRAVPGADLKVVDDKGQSLPADSPGELLARGPMIVPGYWRDPEATSKAIRDGWLHTGDLARIDAEGYVFVLDRKKDMIMRGGYKIYSVQLEYLLLSHPGVQEAAVVGIPDPLFYEEVMAAIVRADSEEGRSLSSESLRAFVAERAADYEVPKFVVFRESLPRNPTGKVKKNQLRDEYVGDSS
jgi:long-chain acyl-CoA synthetase